MGLLKEMPALIIFTSFVFVSVGCGSLTPADELPYDIIIEVDACPEGEICPLDNALAQAQTHTNPEEGLEADGHRKVGAHQNSVSVAYDLHGGVESQPSIEDGPAKIDTEWWLD
jgi:hypothetical protein